MALVRMVHAAWRMQLMMARIRTMVLCTVYIQEHVLGLEEQCHTNMQQMQLNATWSSLNCIVVPLADYGLPALRQGCWR